jgi:DNA-binding CsgD family transcriptional regulator/tetratricopeptide (TPR) repeat protein
MPRPILERERELAELGAAAQQAKTGEGSIVLVLGEAGIGKSSLVEAVRSVLPAEGRLLVGYCDDLATPRVLGPLRDLIGSVGTGLTRALESGDRAAVIEALRADLDRPGHPTVLVIEDVHWIDDASLDVLMFLARRIALLPAVLVVTYRDEEVTRDHPLQRLLGLASRAPRVRRLRLARLSAQAVRRLGEHTRLDPAEVFAVTAGNPFFVTEVLASGEMGAVPPTIAEAVLARLSDVDERTRDALERLAVVPSAVERWLAEAVLPSGLESLVPAEERGLLAVAPGRITFRHELMRRSIVDSLPAVRRVEYNRAVLAALRDSARGVDLSRLVHHAEQAGDGDVIVQSGPAAAREAVAAGSHREAVSHYRLVLEHLVAFAAVEQAELLQGYAIECYTIGLAEQAVRAQEEAVRVRRGLDDPNALGVSLRWLSRAYWWAGSRPQAEVCGAEAIEVLETAGDGEALALALSNLSQLNALAGYHAQAVEFGERAIAMAREFGDPGLLSHALNNVGLAEWDRGNPRGRELAEESLAIALAAHDAEHASRAYINIVWHLTLETLELEEADRILDEAIELADRGEILGYLRYMHVTRGMIRLAQSRWEEAEHEAEWAAGAQLNMRCPALTVMGRARNRGGRPDGDELLAQAWEIARKLDEPQRLSPSGSALIEGAWLRGDPARAVAQVEPKYETVYRFGSCADAAQLGYWMRLAGADVPVQDSGHPYALQALGRWREAAGLWQRAGYRYEYALALAESPDPADLLEALATLDELGAAPLGKRVRQRLKELGVTRVPRGPVPSTRDNPAGLTDRQAEVLTLLAQGLSNAEIAARLVLSIRTVDTHVAAVLDKLNARTRREAVVRAKALGLG